MEILKFKTNIKCEGCIAAVTPFLNNEKSIHKWQVDINSPDKILTVSGEDVNPQQVENLLNQAGYKSEFMQVYGAGGNSI